MDLTKARKALESLLEKIECVYGTRLEEGATKATEWNELKDRLTFEKERRRG